MRKAEGEMLSSTTIKCHTFSERRNIEIEKRGGLVCSTNEPIPEAKCRTECLFLPPLWCEVIHTPHEMCCLWLLPFSERSCALFVDDDFPALLLLLLF